MTKPDLTALEGRFNSSLEQRTAGIRDEINSKMNDRLAEFTRDFPSRADLSAFETQLDANYGERVKRLETGFSDIRERQVSRSDLSAFQQRLDASFEQRFRVLREELGGSRGNERLETFDARLEELATRLSAFAERPVVAVTDINALEARLGQRINADVSAAVEGVRSDLGSRLNAKADANALEGLQRSVSGLQSDNQRLARRVDGVDVRLREFDNTVIIRPP